MKPHQDTVDWHAILRQLLPPGELPTDKIRSEPVAGGCINQTLKLSCGNQHYFVKLNHSGQLRMFEDEADGLAALASTGTIRIPTNLGLGTTGKQAYLILEYLDLDGHGDPALAGEQLATLHRHQGKQFGWHRNNTIGSTSQPNTGNDAWPTFWQQCRLGHQLDLAASHGETGKIQERGRRLLEAVPLLLDHNPPPSLLHGDLWSGNFAYDRNGSPVIFDPAVYYGDRETDLAMSELFGGFPADFYDAYHATWPLPPGYPVRKRLYNLYHILNHLNLFGGGYRQQAMGMIEALLAELG